MQGFWDRDWQDFGRGRPEGITGLESQRFRVVVLAGMKVVRC